MDHVSGEKRKAEENEGQSEAKRSGGPKLPNEMEQFEKKVKKRKRRKTKTEKIMKENSKKCIDRWQRDFKKGKLKLGLLPGYEDKEREVVKDEETGKIMIREKCVGCKECKWLLPEYFNTGNKMRKEFHNAISGKESYRNSGENPCKTCKT